MDDNSVILRRISNRNSAAHFHVSATRTSPAAGCNPRPILPASQRSTWRIWRSSNSTSITKARNAELLLGGGRYQDGSIGYRAPIDSPSVPSDRDSMHITSASFADSRCRQNSQFAFARALGAQDKTRVVPRGDIGANLSKMRHSAGVRHKHARLAGHIRAKIPGMLGMR